MRLPARHGRKDKNHGEIVEALKRVGCGVIDLSQLGGGVPDLLVSLRNGRRRELILVEVKTATGKLNARQRAFEAAGWEVYTVRSVDEVLKVVGL
jgi:VRR-NUC domain-containing protein